LHLTVFQNKANEASSLLELKGESSETKEEKTRDYANLKRLLLLKTPTRLAKG